MDKPYFYRIIGDDRIIIDAASLGAIAPDGNETYLAFLAWVDENGEPPIVPDPEPIEPPE